VFRCIPNQNHVTAKAETLRGNWTSQERIIVVSLADKDGKIFILNYQYYYAIMLSSSLKKCMSQLIDVTFTSTKSETIVIILLLNSIRWV